MLKHIVTWKLKPTSTMQDAELIKTKLEALIAIIPEIKKIEVGINALKAPQENWDILLYSEFLTFEDLAKYQIHPAHKEAGLFIKNVVENRVCVDYESE